jgi:uncharacterized membrane protein
MDIILTIAYIVSVIGGAIVILGVIRALVELVLTEVRRMSPRMKEPSLMVPLWKVRIDFASHLLLGLDFLIASDVIHTISAHDLIDLAILGGTVAIRVVLSYFLTREMSMRMGKL